MSVWSEVKDAVVVSCYCVAKPSVVFAMLVSMQGPELMLIC